MKRLKLTTGDSWDTDLNEAIDDGCHPEAEVIERRRSAEYIGQFRERIPLGRAIRLKCGACMGGDCERMPLGEVARAIDECGSSTCPLWPFRFGHDPWRPEMSEELREASRVRMQKMWAPVSFTGARPKERVRTHDGPHIQDPPETLPDAGGTNEGD